MAMLQTNVQEQNSFIAIAAEYARMTTRKILLLVDLEAFQYRGGPRRPTCFVLGKHVA